MPVILVFWEQGQELRQFEVILSPVVEFETLVRDLVGKECLPSEAPKLDLFLGLCFLPFSLSGGWLVLSLHLGQAGGLESLGQFLSPNH